MLHDELRYPSNNIPNITKWTKAQVLEYLSERLPREITDQIAKHDLDGRAILLLNRSDIVSTLMCLKLGSSLKFYREVRILQSQSTHHRVYWE
ncbi:atherin-like [Myzus persicae]|uniref:atherin-like n=1 Tax=Myzus persicae TaxID=13164 RepID=UPI000B939139|nr:atherin-like [Myzus persicae]